MSLSESLYKMSATNKEEYNDRHNKIMKKNDLDNCEKIFEVVIETLEKLLKTGYKEFHYDFKFNYDHEKSRWLSYDNDSYKYLDKYTHELDLRFIDKNNEVNIKINENIMMYLKDKLKKQGLNMEYTYRCDGFYEMVKGERVHKNKIHVDGFSVNWNKNDNKCMIL